ncbi:MULTISPECIES: M12 family metallopeptidase [unclassified Mesorhizobium]|uniref:M12 family metallopeptidase n=1 Tax=unclassified Mesorhizobium TaxID=325217 RepID=UPI0015E2E351|nr:MULTISPECIES: M12 family metallopeptidase [unclassified Mesorhizobium]MCA0056832.1 hypothetical protein [Mesorhizobium sp. B261B1A]
MVLIASCSGTLFITPVLAHDIVGLLVESSTITPETAQKFGEIDRSRDMLAGAAGGHQDVSGLEGVVREALRWPGSTISVCFFGGTSQAREQVSQIANEWTLGSGISFDFGPQGGRRSCNPEKPSNVRVSFDGMGFWSYVGTKARFIDPSKQTLNLSGMGAARPFSSSERGTILHEFGHALGFEHEHQSPVGGCDNEFNWNYLYTALGWDKAKVDFNMRQLSVSSREDGLLYVTPFDRDSIMLYSLAPEAFIDPANSSCFISRKNDTLSEVDVATERAMYPASVGNEGAPAMAPAAGPVISNLEIRGTVSALQQITGGQ